MFSTVVGISKDISIKHHNNYTVMEVDEKLRRYAPVVLFIGVSTIVVADLIFPSEVILTWQLVSLIGVLVVLPFIPLIKRISYGELEAELGERVEQTEKDVEENLPVPEEVTASDYLPTEIPQRLYDLFEISHVAALAMLRTEIETVLKEIAGDIDEPATMGQVMRQIEAEGELSPRTVAAIREVQHLANEAIHTGQVPVDEANEILDIGIDALERLYYYKEEGEPRYQ